MSGSNAILPYRTELKDVWNATLENSKAPLFIFNRDYMDYHSDRFVDLSAMGVVGDKPAVLFPASIDRSSGEVCVHAGLTFGAPLIDRKIRTPEALELISLWLTWLADQSAKKITVKIIPPAFTNYPSDELSYALWRNGFEVSRRDLSSILPINDKLPFNTSKTQSVKKAKRSGVKLVESNVDAFHSLLDSVLMERHDTRAVHSLSELELLIARFPDQIKLRCCGLEDSLLAGALIYDYGHVWHTQYLASSPEGRSLGALDFVIEAIIDEAEAAGVRMLSFGTSSEAAGTVVNEGLLFQKESYGARAIVHEFMTKSL